jgi:hypothetical protein
MLTSQFVDASGSGPNQRPSETALSPQELEILELRFSPSRVPSQPERKEMSTESAESSVTKNRGGYGAKCRVTISSPEKDRSR